MKSRARRKDVCAKQGCAVTLPDGSGEVLGLAFSGGGIRSATFNLGVLQGLARLRLLPRVDYLSTVSGGGYIGAWFTTLIARRGLAGAIEALRHEGRATSDSEQRRDERPINFLRQFSNYLTPKVGVFSIDTLTAAAIYLRNTLLNLTVLCLAVTAAILLPTLAASAAQAPLTQARDKAILWLVFYLIVVANYYVRARPAAKKGSEARVYPKFMGPVSVQSTILAPAIVLCWLLVDKLALWDFDLWGDWLSIAVGALIAGAVALSLDGLKALRARLRANPPSRLRALLAKAPEWLKEEAPSGAPSFSLSSALARAAAVAAGFWAAWAALLHVLQPRLAGLRGTAGAAGNDAISRANLDLALAGFGSNTLQRNELAVMFGPAAVMLCLALAVVVFIGFSGREMETGAREWWGRLGGLMNAYVAGWLGLCAVVFFSSELIQRLGATLSWSAVIAWLGTSVGGLAAARREPGAGSSELARRTIAAIAPYVFVVGLLAALTVAIDTWFLANSPNWRSILAGAAVAIGAGALLSWRFDLNEFSMHNFYRNRLVRAYLGASDDSPTFHPFTGFDARQDFVRISDLRPELEEDTDSRQRREYTGLRDAAKEKPVGNGTQTQYDGPYHLVNMALNLVGGKNLAWQERKATSFMFSPRYSGFDTELGGEDKQSRKLSRYGYRPTDRYDGGISLGTAIATSGAAASPNMGKLSTPALGFLMTVFNVRLGYWLGNPRSKNKWMNSGPTFGLGYLLTELLGLTNERRNYVYLSDGGHFENLGLYELVKRGCRYIIVCDAAADPRSKFGDLGAAVSKCRADLGVDIDLKGIETLEPGENGFAKAHYLVGKIRYPLAEEGYLLYFKPALTGDEPADVLAHRKQHKDFPQQSTADQWFGESQFESYRRLGLHTLEQAAPELIYTLGDRSVWEQMNAAGAGS